MATITCTTDTYRYFHEETSLRWMEETAMQQGVFPNVWHDERNGVWTGLVSLEGGALADFVRGLAGDPDLYPEEGEDRTMADRYTLEIDDSRDAEMMAGYEWLFAPTSAA